MNRCNLDIGFQDAEGEMAADSLDAAMGGKGSVVIIAGQAGNGTTIGRVGAIGRKLTLSSVSDRLDT